MKKTMRFLSCLLIMAMLVTMMAVPAYADEPTGQITLAGPTGENISAKEFALYRIFDASVNSGTDAISYDWIVKDASADNNAEKYYFYSMFFGGVTGFEPLIGAAPSSASAPMSQVLAWVETEKTSDAWVSWFGQQIYAYMEAVGIDTFKVSGIYTHTENSNVQSGGTEQVFSNLPYGYYLIYETTTIDSEVRSAILLTNIDDNVEATLKTARTDIIKQVKRDSLPYNGLSSSIGRQLTFYIETTVPNFMHYEVEETVAGHDEPIFRVIDIPGNSISLPEITSPVNYVVHCGTTLLTQSNTDGDGGQYTITKGKDTNGVEDGRIIFDFEYDYIKTVPNHKIYIEYNATLNTNATPGGIGTTEDPGDKAAKNTAQAEFSSDPYNLSKTDIVEDDARVYSFILDVYKKAATGTTPLAGAVFKLQNVDTGMWAKAEAGKIVDWVITEDDATSFTTGIVTENSSEVAKTSIKGLGRGSYALKEISAPDGYYLPTDPFLFIVGGKTDDATGVLTELNLTSTDAAVTNKTGNIESGTVTMTVSNSTSAFLPTTGGMGTTLFTIGGLILMAGAAALLMARKKTEK